MVGERYSRCVKSYKGHEKWIFDTPHDEMKCILSFKEPNFNVKNGSNFTFA